MPLPDREATGATLGTTASALQPHLLVTTQSPEIAQGRIAINKIAWLRKFPCLRYVRAML